MSRIYYRGKLYDYPIKPSNALRNLGPVEALRCVLSYLLGPGAPAEGPDDARGLHRRPLRPAALQPLLQDLQREGLGRPGVARCPPTSGRSASRACRCSPRSWEPVRAKIAGSRNKSKQVTSLIEEFNYPKYGPGQMWETCSRAGQPTQGTEGACSARRVTKIEHADGGYAARSRPRADGVHRARYECTDVISSMPFGAAARRRWTRRSPAEVTRRRPTR